MCLIRNVYKVHESFVCMSRNFINVIVKYADICKMHRYVHHTDCIRYVNRDITVKLYKIRCTYKNCYCYTHGIVIINRE